MQLWKPAGRSLKKLKLEIELIPAILLLDIFPQRAKDSVLQ